MTTRRPLSFASKRPASAIFLGNQSLPENIPDLPDPPVLSPGAKSTASGLPSPPASNSTGSGSTGDRSVNGDNSSQRQSMMPESPTNMHYGNYDKARNASSTSLVSSGGRKSIDSDAEDDMDETEDKDETARLRRRMSTKPVSDNMLALQRVKDLTQRNKMAIDKLSMFTRHTPSPSLSSRSGRSPLPPSSTSTSSSHSASAKRRDLSGSETERESEHLSLSYTSDEDADAPPSSYSRPTSSLSRQRRISAPASPEKPIPRHNTGNSDTSPGPSNTHTPRKRVSLAMSNVSEYTRDVAGAALAAVASSRRSPSGRRRNPLPREFTTQPPEPTTPRRERLGSGSLGSPSPRGGSSAHPPQTPYSPRLHRTASRPLSMSGRPTVRDPFRRFDARWQSHDSRFVNLNDHNDAQIDLNVSPSARGRRLSTELTPHRRSLVSEGLRAAGIVRKSTGPEDVFTDETSHRPRLMTTGIDREGIESPIESANRHELAPSRIGQQLDPRTPGARTLRPATSMADYQRADPPRTAPAIMRTQNSTQSALESTVRERLLADVPERYNSPVGSLRRNLRSTTPSPLNATVNNGPATEHGKLMLDSLNVFESQLSRLPPMGPTTTSTIPEVFRNAQNMVHTIEHLNSLLRLGTNRALEEQIEAEVAGDTGNGAGAELVELWRRVGGEYRESLRVSDEIVRTMTGFMLGIGKILKDASSAATGEGSQQQHLRSISLDDEYTRRAYLSGDDGSASGASGRGGSDGRRSTLSKRSLDHEPRPPSVLNHRSQYRDDPTAAAPTAESSRRPPPSAYANLGRGDPKAVTPGIMQRRVSNPREMLRQESGSHGSTSSRSAEYFDDTAEPSPTPLARHSAAAQSISRRHRVAESNNAPAPVPGLPTEEDYFPGRDNRRKASTASVLTVRPSSSSNVLRSGFQPSTMQTPTTAVTTHTVSNGSSAKAATTSRSSVAFPHLTRGDSSGSGRQVTFSRPSTISAAALNGLQQQVARDARKASGEENAARAGSRTLGSRARSSLDGHMSSDTDNSERPRRRPTIVGVFR